MFKFKKLALILSLLMTLTVAPTNILATENGATPTTIESNSNPNIVDEEDTTNTIEEKNVTNETSDTTEENTTTNVTVSTTNVNPTNQTATKSENTEDRVAKVNYKINVVNGNEYTLYPKFQEAPEGAFISVSYSTSDKNKVLDKLFVNGIENDSHSYFIMPANDVTLTATIKDRPFEFPIKISDGFASTSIASKGTEVKIFAQSQKNGIAFDKWEVVKGNVKLTDETKLQTTFTMPEEAVEIKATYKDKAVVPTPETDEIKFSEVKVYNYRVEGLAKNATKVTLYKNGTIITYDNTIGRNGEFSISNDFVYGSGRYNYSSKRVYPNSNGFGRDAGSYNYVVAVKNGSIVDYARVYNGEYDFNWYVNNSYDFYATDYRYDGYYGYDGYYRYGLYDLSNYKLIATDAKGNVKEYKLSNAVDRRDRDYWRDWNYYPNNRYDYTKAAYISYAESNSYTVKGYGTDAYAKITVKDSNGYTLGTATADSRGDFSVTTNRALRYGEVITIYTSSSKYYRDNYTKFTVGGSKATTTTNASYSNEFKIDSKTLTITKNGVTTTRTLDVAPYIKDGRTMLPLRYVAESLGYDVLWNPDTRIASFSNNNTLILVNIDSPTFTINGTKYTFSVKPEIKNDRINLPIAEIGKALGLSTGNKGEGKNIEWNSVNRTVKITVK